MADSEQVFRLGKNVAAGLHRRYPMVEREDIYQEIALYAITEALEPPSEDLEGGEWKAAMKALRGRLRRAGDRYCRREKAALAGYAPEDECFYSIPRLRELVEVYFQTGITERPPIGRTESVRRTGDGSEAGTWTSSLLDVERGLKMIPADYVHRLNDRYGLGAHMSDSDYAFRLGLTEDQSRGRIRVALLALQRALGGASPWGKGPAPRGSS